MYLKKIAIKNIGPIEVLSVQLPFKQDGNPRPVIFVGENGSGKTILLSQIIDAFYEIGGSIFDDIRKLEGVGYKYYKVSGGLNLQSGKTSGFSLLSFMDKENYKIEYFDKIRSVTKDDFVQLIEDFSLSPDSNNESNQKAITGIEEDKNQSLKKEWRNGVYFYQPAHRYEEPFWKNEPFIDQDRFQENKRFANNLHKELEIVCSTKNNKSFLMDLVLDFSNNQSAIDTLTWNNINDILRKIKGRDDIRFGIGTRGNYRVSIVEQNFDGSFKKQLLPSIDNLSLGESILLNLFINIIRHGDTPAKPIEEIEGIVAIDEVDVHLHTNLQSTILPSLIKFFPKIQFIITTHSPLFLLGMKKIFGEEGFEIINMPNGEIITTERFSEFENAYKVLQETEKFEQNIKKEIERVAKPILFVEGDYDIKYLTRASELLGKKEILNRMKVLDAEGYGGLDKIWKSYDSKLAEAIPQTILLFYDCDMNKMDSQKGKVYKRVIPCVNQNLIKIGVENLFPDKIILDARSHKKAFVDYTPEIKKEVRGQNISIPEKYEVNKDEKKNLCNWLCQNGTESDFEGFGKVFDMIESITLSEQNHES